LLDARQAAEYAELRRRRLEGIPVAYLLGWREFHGLRLRVSSAVLIPRPETEELVEAALERLPTTGTGRVLDLGTGSGAVAIAIAHARPLVHVDAVDISPQALAVAADNARGLGIRNVAFRLADWFSGLEGTRYEVIVGNPPYVDARDPHLAHGDVVHEPRGALSPGPDGMSALRIIIAGAGAHLAPGGWLLLEHGYDQAQACRALMAAAGFARIGSRSDLAGIERVAFGRDRRLAVYPPSGAENEDPGRT
jgi:release factor glutamine methyltransferase